jgi:putative ABC transport system permease protein
VTESALLWVAAGTAGAALAIVGVRALLALAPAGRIPRQEEISVDATALAFALGVSLVTGLVFGLVPAIRATRSNVRDTLAASSRTMSNRDGGLRGALVVAEIALALVLLTGAGLMVQSFVRLRHVELGFRPSGVAAMTIDLPEATYPSGGAMQAAHIALLERLSHAPGVRSAAAVSFIPLGGVMIRGDFTLDAGRRFPNDYIVAKPVVSAGYFTTMGIRMLRGREFTEQDGATAPGVVIVSKSLADRLWPSGNALGQRISLKDKPTPDDWLTIVGVADDVAQSSVEATREPTLYQPLAQTLQPFFLSHMSYLVRTAGDPTLVVPTMRQALREVDPAQAVGSIGPLQSSVARTMAEPLFQARLIGAFSLFALVLAAVGIYGVIAYSVAERTHEIGIRVALGAVRGDVVRLVLRRIVVLVIPGVGIGVAGALATTRVLASLLYTVKPNDPATFAAVTVLLVGVAFVAGLIPARRASRVDPLVALRSG